MAANIMCVLNNSEQKLHRLALNVVFFSKPRWDVGRAEVTSVLIIYFLHYANFLLEFSCRPTAWLPDFAHWRPNFSAGESWRPENSCLLRTQLQGGPKNTKLSYFVHIFAKYWPIFTIFSPVLCKKFATHWHARTPHLLCCYSTL